MAADEKSLTEVNVTNTDDTNEARKVGRLREGLQVAAALVLPWAVASALLRSRPVVGFLVGLTVGIITLLIFRPATMSSRVVLLIYVAILLAGAILGPLYFW